MYFKSFKVKGGSFHFPNSTYSEANLAEYLEFCLEILNFSLTWITCVDDLATTSYFKI